jgi:hypothetical protein
MAKWRKAVPATDQPVQPQEMKVDLVIGKNPLCMRFFVVLSGPNLEGPAKLKLTCSKCEHEHEYQSRDVHGASGPNAIAINPV